MTRTLDDLERIALALADAARPVPMLYFRRPLDVETKADMSPVTRADRQTEAVLRKVLADLAPDDGVFGEEGGAANLDAPTVWVLDPIDGTKSFVTGLPLFGTLIAAWQGGAAAVGVIEVPALVERYHGVRGKGAFFDGRPITTSGATRLDEARVYLAPHEPMGDAERAVFARLGRVGRVNRPGYDCYQYAQLAAGHVDVVVEVGLKPYDYLALVPVIEGAGGRITDWRGAPLTLESRGDVAAAATPELHAALLAIL